MTTPTPTRVLHRGLDLLLAKDMPGFIGLYADDAVMEFPFAPPGAPTRLEGRAQVHDYLIDYPRHVDIHEIGEVNVMQTDDPEVIVAEFAARGVMVETEKPYLAKYIAVLTIRDGQIQRYRDYWNPMLMTGQTDGWRPDDHPCPGFDRHHRHSRGSRTAHLRGARADREPQTGCGGHGVRLVRALHLRRCPCRCAGHLPGAAGRRGATLADRRAFPGAGPCGRCAADHSTEFVRDSGRKPRAGNRGGPAGRLCSWLGGTEAVLVHDQLHRPPRSRRIAPGGRRNREFNGGRAGRLRRPADIAAVAVHTLIAPQPVNDVLTLTGPQPLSFDEIASALSNSAGRTIRHRRVSPSELADRWEADGLPRDFAELLGRLDEDIAKGSEDRVTTVVADLLGRPPRSFAEFLGP